MKALRWKIRVTVVGLALIAGIAAWFLSTSPGLRDEGVALLTSGATEPLPLSHNHENHQPVPLNDSAGVVASPTGHAHGPSDSLWMPLAGATVFVVALAYAARKRVAARAAFRAFRSFPLAMQAGLLILACGVLVDVLYHVAPPRWTAPFDSLLGPEGHLAHLIMTVGMVFTLLGVVTRRSPVAHPMTASSPEPPRRKEVLR